MGKVYLGDYVYAHFDGYNIVLSLKNFDNFTIVLEPLVIERLIAYRNMLMGNSDVDSDT